MTKVRSKFAALLTSWTRDASGSTAVIFAAATPLLAGTAFVALELSQITNGQVKLQAIADQAAIAAAREMRLGNTTRDAVLNVAKSVVNANTGSLGVQIKFAGKVPDNKSWIKVSLRAPVKSSLATSMGLVASTYSANATAKVLGGAPLCAVALRESFLPGITLDASARIEARKCAVYSNSRFQSSIWIRGNASLSAELICAGGGVGRGTGQISPTPTTDCPKLPDPLANRPTPPVGACISGTEGMKISGEDKMLSPGTYCGGLTISDGSAVTLMPGIYVFKDGPLIVGGGSSLKGVYTGLYFTGANAEMDFQKETTISLSAPKTGPMSGMLIFQDPKILEAQKTRKAAKLIVALTKDETDAIEPLKYEVSSDNASNLLGTIYLPKGRFYSGGDSPIAAQSAYTIIVAYQINAEAGPALTLNSNYHLSDVPVPDGVGNSSNKVILEK